MLKRTAIAKMEDDLEKLRTGRAVRVSSSLVGTLLCLADTQN
jgi:hypothetical protein